MMSDRKRGNKMPIETPKLILLCGWAIGGKGTVAKELQKILGCHWIDIDEMRRTAFGLPDPHPDLSEEAMRLDVEQMTGSYNLLLRAAGYNLRMKRSVIISATFSRPSYWDLFTHIIGRNDTQDRIIWCHPLNDSDEEVERRLEARRPQFGVTCFSSTNSLKRYNEVKGRFEAPALPHLELDTSPPNTVENCVAQALEYIRS